MSKSDMLEALRMQIAAIESGDERFPETDQGPNGGHSTEEESPMLPTKEPSAVNGTANEAYKKILRLVNASDKSQKALHDRLCKDGFEEADIEEALEKARRLSIVDDARYAEVLIRSRASQGKGRAGIVREIEAHDIDPFPLEPLLEEYLPEHDELDRAVAFLQKKPPRSKNLRDGAYRKLIQRGFSSSVAASAARAWTESLGD